MVRAVLTELESHGHDLARRCLSANHTMLTVVGWERLANKLATLNRGSKLITALGIDLSWPGHIDLEPDAEGRLDPLIETNYYSDQAFSFSTATRSDLLLTGYSSGGSEWQGSFEDIDNTFEVKGIGDLYGSVYALERATSAKREPGYDFDMAVTGSCFIAVLIHRAVREATGRRNSSTRPMTVIVGSNECYPFFDAPAVTHDEYEAL